MTLSCSLYPGFMTVATVPGSLLPSGTLNKAMCELGLNSSPKGSNFSTPCLPKVDASCFSTISTPSWRELSIAFTFASSASASISTVATARPRLSATSSRSLQKPCMANFEAASDWRRVRSRRFSMSARVSSSLSLRSLASAVFSLTSALSISTSLFTSSSFSPPSCSSVFSSMVPPSAAAAAAGSFSSPNFPPSALKARVCVAFDLDRPEHANDDARCRSCSGNVARTWLGVCGMRRELAKAGFASLAAGLQRSQAALLPAPRRTRWE
mmetsp:Transcript_18056/g.44744  ORF Transcript_18056/g.44744 Transcript_18056/m.44744 type:complete len:269 (+) Transcript_18056:2539-3345(+)